MATFEDIGVAAGMNIVFAVAFLTAFAILRLQPVNDRVYFPKWYILGVRNRPSQQGSFVTKYVNLDWRAYVRFLDWVPNALTMQEPQIIDHAGLDSAVYLRIYLLGLKIFVPIALLSWAILVPVNWTNNTLANGGASKKLQHSNIGKLSISNIPYGSPRLWTHILMAYAFTFWTCFCLRNEYAKVAEMHLYFLASTKRRPDQFTVLVRNVLTDQDESVSDTVEHFFLDTHPDHYLTHQVVINANNLAKLVKLKKKKNNWLNYYQLKFARKQSRPMTKTGFLGLWGEKVDAIDRLTTEIYWLDKEIADERNRVTSDPKCIMSAAFVSFKSRWSAAVCAQTQQSRNPTLWLTDWASEPRDVYWDNLAIPYVSLSIRKLIVIVAFFFLAFFFVIPVSFVQSLTNIECILKRAPFLKPIIEGRFIKSMVQGVLPGIALKLFLLALPKILIMIAKLEGLLSISALERISAFRYYIFNFTNVFLVSVIAGTAFEQPDHFLQQSANDIAKIIGVSISMKATFFITYVMVDGWASVAGEIFRLTPMVLYHLRNFFLVKTEKDREEAMDPGSIEFHKAEPRIQLYFLLGLVYAVVTPMIDEYQREFPVHYIPRRACSAHHLVPCVLQRRYEPAFVRYPLQEAMRKDTLECATEPNLDLKSYLQSAYIHPVFKNEDELLPLPC
ncbi:hypothetical protein SASPL_153886 [Salvia splendens]|uniref:Calcium permeable stress-gated cation channel 1 n=1 Tax=Salvia splendens TaxID=180675 RepID=A0A8X8YXW8_SALSN|nr:hypothetical protein SASPL_153886 [Salvia splendens]